MTRPLPLASLVVVLLATAGARTVPAGVSAAEEPVTAQAFVSSLGLGALDLREVDRRGALTRSLPVSDGREIATAGVVKLQVPPAFYIDQLKDIVGFKRSEAVLQIGTFSNPARMEDVAGLTLPPDDLTGLRDCRVHSCPVQLSRTAIAQFAERVQWNGAAAEGANAVMRQVLVDLVNEYRTRGGSGLMEYHDRRHPLSAATEFKAMVADPPTHLHKFPSLYRHILNFPSSPAAGVDDLIYWSQEKVGLERVISVTHLAFAPVNSPPVVTAVGSRQIYGSHYFDASLGLTLLLQDATVGPEVCYLLYINRSRINALGGVFGALKRGVVRSRTRSAVAEHLTHARTMVERRYAETRTAASTPQPRRAATAGP